ncbi:MAG: Ig-like domain-containing protein [Ruminococcus sp.]|nr:Ig-like domain-containing protein [Ruminococcus sp.]
MIKKISLFLAICICFGALNLSAFAQSGGKSIPLIAHRGFSSEYPENTMEAFLGAVKSGFDGFECDLWEGSDGTLMIHHDSSVKRTLGLDKNIWELSNEDRLKYPVISGSNIDKYNYPIYIPTLQSVVKLASSTGCVLVLHIKSKSGYKLSDNGVKKILDLLKEIRDNTFIIGPVASLEPFLNKGIRLLRTTSPSNEEDLENVINWCKLNNVDSVLCIKMENLSCLGSYEAFVNYLKSSKIRFALYSAQMVDDYYTVQSMGALFAISDYNLTQDIEVTTVPSSTEPQTESESTEPETSAQPVTEAQTDSTEPETSTQPVTEARTDSTEPETTEPSTSEPAEPVLNVKSLSLNCGESSVLRVNFGHAVQWKSSSPKTAVVKNGRVTALGKGKATVSAVLEDGSCLECEVNVPTSPTLKIRKKPFKPKKLYTINKGEKLSVVITGKAYGLNNKYYSTSKKVARVISKTNAKRIIIKGCKRGRATVKIKVNETVFRIKVKVR